MGDASHSFEAYYKRATSPLIVLQLLRNRVMYGYEISQAMLKKSAGRYTIAVLYPILYRLEEQGYIRVDHTEVINNRARGYYAITDEGEAYLKQSLQEYRELHEVFEQLIGESED